MARRPKSSMNCLAESGESEETELEIAQLLKNKTVTKEYKNRLTVMADLIYYTSLHNQEF